MTEGPTTGDREQQRNDNIASRRQSGLEPMPKDRDQEPESEGEEEETERPDRPEAD